MHDVGEKGTISKQNPFHGFNVLHYRTINYRNRYEFETYTLILTLQTP